ncbi:protein S100-A16-like isoform X2 [Struthio camelus]|uniref:protein S100-A16-like isoform X2 n=1 Tax=Struthio camelus TaxID=8801 RepID=UPI003603BBFF
MGQSQSSGAPPAPGGCGAPPAGASPLEQGLHTVVDAFYSYAAAPGPGQPPSLSPGAFQQLLRHELSRQLTDTGASEAVTALFALLDANGDRRISFDEYWQLVAWICQVIRHRRYGEAPAAPAAIATTAATAAAAIADAAATASTEMASAQPGDGE